MKKSALIIASALMSLSLFAAPVAKPKMFKVTVTNLTKGQPITPPVVAVHSPKQSLFKLGEKASNGLAVLSQDGATDQLVDELDKNRLVKRSAVGGGIIMPGQKQEIMVEANDRRFVLSLVGMLARTNDAFIAARSLTTNLRVGQKMSTLARVYDAGAEMNTQSCDHIPAPPCGNPGVGTEGGEGFVRLHEGVQAFGDLDLQRDTFALFAAQVTVERVQ